MQCRQRAAPGRAGGGRGLGRAGFPSPPAAAPAATVPLSPEEAARYAGIWLDTAADDIRIFSAEGSRLNFVYAGGTYPLEHRGNGRFALGALGAFRFADGAMIETGPNQPAIAFTRQSAALPVAPADFAGTYRSRDVDGELVIRVADNSSLSLTAPFGEMPLDAIHPDGFAAAATGIGHVTFRRDNEGAVAGLTITTLSGIGRMQFDRAR